MVRNDSSRANSERHRSKKKLGNLLKDTLTSHKSKKSSESATNLSAFGHLFFDRVFYRNKYHDVTDLDPLLHWLSHGVLEGRSPHPLVDVEFYRAFNSDVPRGDELRHYLAHGWKEGRSISPFIRSDLFRIANPEWVGMGISPLEFLCLKLIRGKDVVTGLLSTSELSILMGQTPLERLRNYVVSGLSLPSTSKSSKNDINPLETTVNAEHSDSCGPNDWARQISLVIPIHSDHPITRAMLERLEKVAADEKTDIIIVLDGAEQSIVSYVSTLHAIGLRIVHHTESLGFANAVNEGIDLARDNRHVLLVNADVLPRLQVFTLMYEALISEPDLASVTAISNYGSIASYPKAGSESRWLPDHPDTISRAFESDGFKKLVTFTPVCVGHCVLLRRSALEEIGKFDASNFPEGYGEEVDWSIRASKLGWRHGIANRAFVWHQGSTSFKERKTKLLMKGQVTLQRLHGTELMNVAHLVEDTRTHLTYRFQYLDAHLVKTFNSPKKAVLTHTSGGGTFEFIDRECHDLSESVLIFVDRNSNFFRVSVGGHFLPSLELTPVPLEHLGDVLNALGVTEIEVHSGVASDTRLFFLQVNQFVGTKKIFLHDFSPYCARVNLIGGISDTPTFCGAPVDDATCQLCVDKHGSMVGPSSIRDLREVIRLSFINSDQIFVPHKNSEEIWKNWGFHTKVVKHNADRADWGKGKTQSRLDALTVLDGEFSKVISVRAQSLSGRPRVMIPGRISLAKGAELIRQTLVLNRIYGSPIEFVLCGEIDRQVVDDMSLFNLVIGDYDKQLPALAKQLEMDAVWLTSIWPETYMYVLDDLADMASKNVLYLNEDIGAPIDRARSTGFGKVTLVPNNPVIVLQRMMRDFPA